MAIFMDDDSTHCAHCSRDFINNLALRQHYMNSERHTWCPRCSKVFNSAAAKANHTASSSDHNICGTCRLDYPSDADLTTHKEDAHNWCSACDIFLISAHALFTHDIAKHNRCGECGRFFDNENNLRMHQITHAPRTKTCYGTACPRAFRSVSGMLIHLESGACACEVDASDIDEIARERYQPRHYMAGRVEGYMWPCPGHGCGREFTNVSGLFQHIESEACEEGYGEGTGLVGQLRAWIEVCV